ncbi:hypothetical protein ERO13_A08G094362v2 [Gossypium hirsutum]|nr:hypothetical protein ERO13_A08G094362v2 [Gossypium hirsutum]
MHICAHTKMLKRRNHFYHTNKLFINQILVSWCSNIDSRPWELWEVFAKFDHLCSDVPGLEISNIFGEVNCMADALAKTRVDREILFQAWLS